MANPAPIQYVKDNVYSFNGRLVNVEAGSYDPNDEVSVKAAVKAAMAKEQGRIDDVPAQKSRALRASDHEMARVTEELVAILLGRNVIGKDDLSDAMLGKINARRKLRGEADLLTEARDKINARQKLRGKPAI